MPRIRIDLPEQFIFSCQVPVRITDVNYGGHVGNDTILSIVHEARMQLFRNWGYTELEFAGTGIIMADAALEFKSELFYGDIVEVSIAVAGMSRIGFELLYKLETTRTNPGNKKIWVAAVKTGMICYDYKVKKIVAVPEQAREKLLAG